MKKLCLLLMLWSMLLLSTKVSAQQSSAEFRQDTARISACIAQANKYFMKQLQDSLLYFVRQGFQLSQKWDITTYHSPLYRNWGHYYRLTNESDKVLMMYKRARQWAWRHGEKNEIARNGYSLAIAYNLKLRQSMTKANQAALVRQLYENIRFASLYATDYYLHGTYTLLALLGYQYGNDSLQYYYYDKLLPLLNKKTSGDQVQFLYFSFSLSLYHKDPKAAQQYYQAFLKTKNKQDIMPVYANFHVSILSDCIKFGDWDLATQIAYYIQQELSEYRPKITLYVFYVNLASIYLHAKKYPQAAQAILKAQKYATEITNSDILDPSYQLQLLKNEQKIAEYNRQYPQALALYKRINSIKDSLRAIYGSLDFIFLEERLASEQKERDLNQQLQFKRLENEREAERNRQNTRVAVVVIVLLSAVVIVISAQVRKINQQRNRLEALNQTKNRLFSIIGHDLRTPILSTKINLRRLTRQKQLSVSELNSAIHKQLPRLQALLLTVDNLLYWSYNQQDTFQAQIKHVVLNDILQEVLEMLDESIEIGQIAIQNRLADGLNINADSGHLRIILRNVIQNAIKFTPRGGQISLQAEVMQYRVTLVVKDTGIGFEQSQKDTSKQSTGLGLQLVKELLELNNGALEIATAPEEGAEVRLHFQKA